MASVDPIPTPSVVILAGGIGSRFWPASRPERPKQLLPLGTRGQPLIRDAVDRALALTPPSRIEILAGKELLAAFRPLLPELPDSAFVPEPARKGTGPVLAWAAHRIGARHGPDTVMVSLHADHRIQPLQEFVRVIRTAMEVAREPHCLVTIGIRPDRPETGYGWIEAAPAREGSPSRMVTQFREKPDADTAREFLARGLLWNSGLFIWQVESLLEAFRIKSPEVGPHLELLDSGDPGPFFRAVTAVAVDVAVLERSPDVALVEAGFQWDDVGTWEALARSGPSDPAGNVVFPAGAQGHLKDAGGNVVWAEDGPVHLMGVRDLVVVRSGGHVVVARREDVHSWKEFLGELESGNTEEVPS